jgi:murein hydrolase activator
LQDLEQQRLKLIQDINKTSALLSQYKKDKTSNISTYNTMEEQLDNSTQLFATLQKEISLLQTPKEQIEITPSIDKKNKASDSLLINMMKDAYRQQLLHPNKTEENALRKSYVQQLISYKKRSGTPLSLGATDALLIDKKYALVIEQQRMDSLTAELKMLKEELKDQITSTQETEAILNEKTSLRASLNQKIEALMIGQPKSTAPSYSYSTKTLNDKKGFVPWPMNEGKIKLRYGEQQHPDDSKVTFINSGIDISSADNQVLSVHDGTVITVTNISPSNITVIVQHDNDYYSVYSNMAEAYKRKGDIITTSELIGISNVVDGQYVLHFELWQAKNNLNPYQWLKNN